MRLMTTTTPHNATTEHLLPGAHDALTTGWGPDVPVGDTLLRNYSATLRHRLVTTAERTEGRVKTTEHALFVDLDSAYVFDNLVVGDGPRSEAETRAMVGDALAFYPPDRPFAVQLPTPTVDLRDLGLVLLGHPPLMYRPVGGAPPAPSPGLDIRRVTDHTTLADFERTLIDTYPLPRGSTAVDPRLLGPDLHAWVGYVDDAPVATAGSHTAYGLTEVEWVSTRDTHRGRGIGAALTWAATSSTPDVPAVLAATDDGRPVYERLGYVALQRLTMWLRP